MAYTDDVQLTPEYQALVAKEVERQFQAMQAGSQGTTSTAPVAKPDGEGGYSMKLWGTDYTFKSASEMQDFMERFMQTAMEEAGKGTKTAPPQQTQSQPTGPRVDVERYVELLAKDPLAAERYKNLQVYGVEDPITLVAQQVGQIRAALSTTQVQSVAEQFKRQTESFPTDDPNAGLLLSQTVQRLGIQPTVEGLQAAWNHVLASGAYKQQNSSDSSDMSFTNSPSRQGIPHLSGGVSPGYNPVLERFADLPLEQMEAALKNIERGGSL